MRRNRIAENMKKLQDLIPDVDKQANTADMLEYAIDYVKYLSDKVMVSECAKLFICTCSASLSLYIFLMPLHFQWQDLSGGNKELLNFRSQVPKPSSSPRASSYGASSGSETND